jgi:hypothetical protein
MIAAGARSASAVSATSRRLPHSALAGTLELGQLVAGPPVLIVADLLALRQAERSIELLESIDTRLSRMEKHRGQRWRRALRALRTAR